MASAATKNASISTASSSGGPQLILLSLAGITTAAGISFTRWILTETGTVLLLFSGEEENNVVDTTYYCNDESGTINDDNNFYLEGEEISSSCIPPPSTTTSSPTSSTTSETIGQFLLSISTSPHLRSIPLLLILISSTTLIIGIIRTHRQCIKLTTHITNYYYNNIVLPIIKSIFGEELYDEMEVALTNTTTTTTTTTTDDNNGSNSLLSRKQQAILLRTNVKMKMDNLIIDKHLQKFIQNGIMEFVVCGIGGGICLYSLPDTLFSSSTSSSSSPSFIVNGGKKNTSSGSSGSSSNSSALVRQRVIHAVDPWLERVLFTPGGVWELIPNGLREFIVEDGGERNQGSDTVTAAEQHGMNIKKLVNDDTCLDTTQETLVGTEISATVGSIGSTDNETDEDDDEEDIMMNNAVPPPLSSVEMRTRKTTAPSSNETREESVGEALYATICDVVASNLTSAFHARDVSQQPSSSRHYQEEKSSKPWQQSSTKTPSSSSPPSTSSSSSSPQQLHIERVLHHTSIAATTIFLCQFLSSPSTRRSWMSTIKFLTSMGLFSTAVSAGLASYLLRRSEMARLRSDNSTTATTVVTLLSSKVFDWLVRQVVSFSPSSFPLYSTISSSLPLDTTIMSKIQVVFQRIREEIKKNKRLQATFALVMLYGIKKHLLLSGKRRGRTSRR